VLLEYNSLPAQSTLLPSIDSDAENIESRFHPPEGFKRIPVDTNSFAQWLRNMPLLPSGSPVLDYRGRIFKSADDTSVTAVINMNINRQNLLQCMDVIIRFRMEYQWEKGLKNNISSILPDGLPLSWPQWSDGYRPGFAGAHYYLKKIAKENSTYQNFKKYLNQIFELTGTQAFYHYYPDVEPADVRIGDFIIKKGNHGHAVMIIDLACNEQGEMLALIGQGDTPACQFYLLRYNKDSVWFPVDFSAKYLPLPIKKKMCWSDLRRFPD